MIDGLDVSIGAGVVRVVLFGLFLIEGFFFNDTIDVDMNS